MSLRCVLSGVVVPSVSITDVRIVGWDSQVGSVLELVFFSGLLVGAVLIVVLTAAALAMMGFGGR